MDGIFMTFCSEDLWTKEKRPVWKRMHLKETTDPIGKFYTLLKLFYTTISGCEVCDKYELCWSLEKAWSLLVSTCWWNLSSQAGTWPCLYHCSLRARHEADTRKSFPGNIAVWQNIVVCGKRLVETYRVILPPLPPPQFSNKIENAKEPTKAALLWNPLSKRASAWLFSFWYWTRRDQFKKPLCTHSVLSCIIFPKKTQRCLMFWRRNPCFLATLVAPYISA